MKRRSGHTQYAYAEALIYEYRSRYFVIEACQQGRVPNPAHGPRQNASDVAGLSTILPSDYSDAQMGLAVIQAIADFDTRPPPFPDFDLPARNKVIKGWMNARGISTLEKNSRLVQIYKHEVADAYHGHEADTYTLIPFDNCILHPWWGPAEADMTRPMKQWSSVMTLPGSADEATLGHGIRKAFEISTCHPERTDPPNGL